MPDFTARFSSGTVVEAWVDPPTVSQPTRINPDPDLPHLRHRAVVGDPAVITATVNGVDAPLDGALGGRLFKPWVADKPGGAPVSGFTHPGGQSSVQTFIPPFPGHYVLGLHRDEGGAVLLHLDAVV